MQDAQDVMDMLVKVQNDQGDMEPDDPQVRREGKKDLGGEGRNYFRLIGGWGKKKRFEIYLPCICNRPPPLPPNCQY